MSGEPRAAKQSCAGARRRRGAGELWAAGGGEGYGINVRAQRQRALAARALQRVVGVIGMSGEPRAAKQSCAGCRPQDPASGKCEGSGERSRRRSHPCPGARSVADARLGSGCRRGAREIDVSAELC
jgi:hypothetical protein